MDFLPQLLERAKRSPKSIVFPESCEAKVLQAAKKVLDLGIAEPYLVGSATDITTVAAEAGVDLSGFTVLNSSTESARVSLTHAYLAISDEFSEKTLMRKFKAPLSYAAAMVRCGKADCLAAGYTYPMCDVIRACQAFIGMAPDISAVSSLEVLEIPGFETAEGHLLAAADCAVCPAPASSALADIAISSAETMKKLLGWEPRVATLSFSAEGSIEHDAAEKIRKAAGKANIIVFPGLGEGDIGVKLIQTFDGGLAYGPIIQGFARPVTGFSRSATPEEIVGSLAMLVVLANKTEGVK